ncbi:hypothetical protein [Marinobacter shengliensis]|uniref:hypothetical protein n=1 Tax=Marinobacter shengliensis TaxID=1389223 RepID=UPI001E5CF947|nr:hypothetical protein [Marinobacter shengliensis]MCD1628284.1 hypothetical protein [Marinobacter shengliensis]
MTEHKSTADLSREELEVAFDELVIHFEKTVRHLEHATQLLAKLGKEQGQALAWLKEIRHAAGATAPGISHREVCLLIKDLRHKAMEVQH